ncbi:MAG TPA: hypothetical protein VIL42_01085 [Sphingomicrobium sp.]
MPNYRLYRLDGAGRISGADWIEAADDVDASNKARERAAGSRYELWQQDRLIERIAAKGK